MINFGAKIKVIRLAKGMTQEQLEKRCGIKREYLSKLETGGLPNTTIGTLKKVADSLGVPLVSLLAGEDEPVRKATEADIMQAERRGAAAATLRCTQELADLIGRLKQGSLPWEKVGE